MFPISTFENFRVACDPAANTLYFPFHDADGQMVGYKMLTRQHDQLIETTFPETNCFGVLMSAVKATKDTSAVIVLNVPDLLALSQHKLNSL